MAQNRPNKPSVTLPDNFGGVKNEFSSTRISNGYESSTPEIVEGGNLNYMLDGLFQNTKYMRTVLDYVRDTPVGRMFWVNSNGQMDYVQPSIIATDTEFSTGTATDRTPNVKQVVDNLNTRALNSGVVHLSGTEVISGNKTFSANLVKQSNSLEYKGIHIQNTQISKGTTPSSTAGGQFVFQDKDGLGLVDRIGGVEITYDSSGNIKTQLIACQPSATSVMYDSISITYPTNGNAYTSAPTPTDTTTTSGSQIATTGWVNSANNNVVHKTGNETITGTKTFTASYNVKNDAVKGTAPSADNVRQLQFCDKNGSIIGTVYNTYTTNKNNNVGFAVNKANSASDTDRAFLFVTYPATGNPYTFCPASDVNGSIVTTVNKSKAANGYFQLGNGLIIQWGTRTDSGNVTFPKAFTTHVSVSLSTDNGIPNPSNITKTGFTASSYNPGGTPVFNWIAIGY